jgi:hypothetical protein
MNEITFVLAVLVNKEIITKQEAQKLHKSMTQNILNSNIGEEVVILGVYPNGQEYYFELKVE